MFEDFFELRDSLNIPNDESDINMITNIYNVALKGFDGAETLKEYLIWDLELMSCRENSLHIGENKNNRLVPMFVWKNEDEWPDIKNFKKEQIQFYDECINKTSNPIMKIRYLDYLADYSDSPKRYGYAMRLFDELIAICIPNEENYYRYLSSISRVVDIAVKYSKQEKMRIVEKILIEESDRLIDKKSFRWILELSQLLRYLCYYNRQKRINEDSIIKTIGHLEEARVYYKEIKDIYIYQPLSWELTEWCKAEKYTETDIKKILIEIGEAFEFEAEYQSGREKSSLIEASFLENAVNHYIKIGEGDRIPELKTKIKNAYKRMKDDNELKVVSTELKITKEMLESEANIFRNSDVSKSFGLLSYSTHFVQGKKEIKESTERIYKDSILSRIANLSSVYGGRKIFQANSEEDHFKYNYHTTYNIGLHVRFGIFYKYIWDDMITNGLNEEMIIGRITSWKYMKAENKIIIEHGIRMLFKEDYVSSLHILVPQFENVFREFFHQAGFATTSIKANTTQHEQNFNDFLRNEFVKANIDEDILYFIEFVLVDNTGYNLRNNIAHGIASIETFSKTNCLIVIYLYFLLTNYIWETNVDIEGK
jgi:hypothetical protein